MKRIRPKPLGGLPPAPRALQAAGSDVSRMNPEIRSSPPPSMEAKSQAEIIHSDPRLAGSCLCPVQQTESGDAVDALTPCVPSTPGRGRTGILTENPQFDLRRLNSHISAGASAFGTTPSWAARALVMVAGLAIAETEICLLSEFDATIAQPTIDAASTIANCRLPPKAAIRSHRSSTPPIPS